MEANLLAIKVKMKKNKVFETDSNKIVLKMK